MSVKERNAYQLLTNGDRNVSFKEIYLPPPVSHTRAVPLLCGQSKAVVAATLETSDGVPAISMSAKTLEHFALIYIWGQSKKMTFRYKGI